MKKIICALLIIIAINTIAKSQNWTQKNSMSNYARFCATSFTIKSTAYVGLGQKQDGTKVYDFWKYDSSSNTWTKIAAYPGAGSYAATAFTINGKGYVCLGADNSNNCQNDLWEYTPETDTWLQKASFPGIARYAAISFVISDTAFIGTGSPGGPNYLNDMWMYVPGTDSWSQKANVPSGSRSHAVAFTINNSGYFGSGLSNSTTATNDFWKYNKNNDSWSGIANIPASSVTGAVGFTVNGKGCVGTGCGSYPFVNTNNFFEYDPVINTWNTIIKPVNATTRHNGIGFSIGNTCYFGTGYSDSGLLSDLWGLEIIKIECTTSGLKTLYCKDNSVILTAPEYFKSYSWKNPIGSTVGKAQTITIDKPTENDIYTCEDISALCTNTFIDTLIMDNCSLKVSNDTTICKGDSALIFANGAQSYTWNSGETNPQITATTSGDYTVTGVFVSGTTTKTIHVTVSDLPGTKFTLEPPEISRNSSDISFKVSNPNPLTIYNWDLGDGTYFSGTQLTHSYVIENNESKYIITLTAFNISGCTSSETKFLTIIPFIPNVFTPNSDGRNDLFMSGYDLQIVDRYGIVIYKGNKGWDGTYKGTHAKPDTYFYYIIMNADDEGIKKSFKGFVLLVR